MGGVADRRMRVERTIQKTGIECKIVRLCSRMFGYVRLSGKVFDLERKDDLAAMAFQNICKKALDAGPPEA